MSEPNTDAELGDVIVPTEEVHPDHREHAKEPHPVDDDQLERRARHERDLTGATGPVDDE